MIPIACSFVFMVLYLTFRDEARLCSLRPAWSVCIHVDEFAIDLYTIGHARNLPPRLTHSPRERPAKPPQGYHSLLSSLFAHVSCS
jgi:hypothetical protein